MSSLEKSLNNLNNCKICLSKTEIVTSRKTSNETIHYFKCSKCGLIQSEFPDSVVVTENDNDVARNQTQINLMRLRRITSRTHRLVDILDFGCGNGQFVDYCKSQGYVVDGIDQHTTLQLNHCSNDKYDAIFMTEVLEHLKEPQHIINELFRVLKPNGLLYIEGTFADRITNIHTNGYISPEIGHRLIHTEKSISIMIGKKGLIERLSDNVFIIQKR